MLEAQKKLVHIHDLFPATTRDATVAVTGPNGNRSTGNRPNRLPFGPVTGGTVTVWTGYRWNGYRLDRLPV
ncbi:unnamed protein product, partial [Rotaria magnacalcarata]